MTNQTRNAALLDSIIRDMGAGRLPGQVSRSCASCGKAVPLERMKDGVYVPEWSGTKVRVHDHPGCPNAGRIEVVLCPSCAWRKEEYG